MNGRSHPDRGRDLDVLRRRSADDDRRLVNGALPDQTLTWAERVGDVLPIPVRVARMEPQHRLLVFRVLHPVKRPMLRVDEGGDFGKNQPGHRRQITLPLEHPGEAGEVGLEPVLLGRLLRGLTKSADHLIDLVLQQRDLATRLNADRPGQVSLCHGSGDVGDGADLGGQVGSELVDVLGQARPGTGGSGNARLPSELAVHAHLTRDRRHLFSKRRKGVDHGIDGLFQGRDLTLGLELEFALELAGGDRAHHPGDPAHLVGQVAGHHIDVVGQVLPDPGHALHAGLPAQLALDAHLAGDPGDLGGEGVQLIDHHVDRVFQLENLTVDVDGDLAGQVTAGNGGRDLGDVAHLRGEVGRQLIHVVGEVLPDSADAADLGLSTEPALAAHLPSHARDLGRKSVQLVNHHVDRVLELQDLAPHVDRDLLRQVAAGNRRRDLGDVANLGREVAGHRVDVVGQVLPGSGDARNAGLPTEPAFGSDLSRDPADLGGEGVQLVDHHVDRVLELQDLAPHRDRDFFGKVTAGDRRRDVRNVADLRRQVRRHRVHTVGEVLPYTGHVGHPGLAPESAFTANFSRHPRDLRGKGTQLLDGRVDGFRHPQVLTLERPALQLQLHRFGEVAVGDRVDDPGHSRKVPDVQLIAVDEGIELGRHLPGNSTHAHRHPRGKVPSPDLVEHREQQTGIDLVFEVLCSGGSPLLGYRFGPSPASRPSGTSLCWRSHRILPKALPASKLL